MESALSHATSCNRTTTRQFSLTSLFAVCAAGEAENRREIRKAVGAQQDGEGGKLSDEDDDEEEEEEQHGLEDLGDAFLGPLSKTQEMYKEKLKAKLEQVRRACTCEAAAIGSYSVGVDVCITECQRFKRRNYHSEPAPQEQEAERIASEARSGTFNNGARRRGAGSGVKMLYAVPNELQACAQ